MTANSLSRARDPLCWLKNSNLIFRQRLRAQRIWKICIISDEHTFMNIDFSSRNSFHTMGFQIIWKPRTHFRRNIPLRFDGKRFGQQMSIEAGLIHSFVWQILLCTSTAKGIRIRHTYISARETHITVIVECILEIVALTEIDSNRKAQANDLISRMPYADLRNSICIDACDNLKTLRALKLHICREKKPE